MSAPLSLRSNPSFARLATARGLSGIGFQMLIVALGWQLYALTGSAFDLGLVGLVQFGPMLIASPLAGVVADAFDRRRIAAVSMALSALVVIGLALGTATGWTGRGHILASVAILGLVRAFEFPTLSALIPLTVPQSALPEATALYASANQTAVICGPAIGGLLILLGPAWPYAIAGAIFLLAAILVSGLVTTPQVRRTERVTLETVTAGVRYLWNVPSLFGALSLDLAAVVLGGAMALLPIIAKDVLAVGPLGLGILRTGPAIGALAMALWLARNPIRSLAGPKMFAGVAIYGFGTIAFGFSTWFPLSLAALVVLGAADMVSVVVRQSLVQVRTPDEMRGRVGAVNAMFISSSNQLGDFRAGAVAAAYGAVPAIIAGGVASVLIAATWIWLYPGLRKLERV